MKKEYMTPDIEFTSIKNADVITLSVAATSTYDAGSAIGINSSVIPF